MAVKVQAAPTTEARIGERLKRRREQQSLSLRTLAARAGFSPSFLSQVEHGLVSPSITSLERIAAELGVTLSDLFEVPETRGARVVRTGARAGFSSAWSRARVELLTPQGSRRALEAVSVRLQSRGSNGAKPVAHAVDQFAYVVQGQLVLWLGEGREVLEAGDAVMIPLGVTHRWQNESAGSAEVVLVAARWSD